MVGVGDLNHPLVELIEIFKEAAGVEKQLLFEAQAASVNGLADGSKGGFTHHFFVMEQAEYFI